MTLPHRVPDRELVQRLESGVARFDQQALDVLRQIDPRWKYSPSIAWFALVILTAGFSFALGGLGLAVVAVTAVLLVPVGLTWLATRRRRQHIADHLADFCSDIARGLRAGQTIPLSLDAAIASAPHLVPPAVLVAMSEHRAGRALDVALESWVSSALTSAERLVASALSIGVVAGGRVGLSLDLMSEAVGAELHAAQRHRAITAQARYSARLLTTLPFGVAVLVGIGTDSALYSEAPVWIALGLGVLFALLGWTWMNWLIGRVA